MEVTRISRARAYAEFRSDMLRYVKSKVRSTEDAEDIVQNVFIKISSNVDKLKDQVKLKNWLFTIAQNAIIDYYRLNAKKKKFIFTEEIGAADPDPTKGLDLCIDKMIRLLPDEYREIIVESEIHGIRQKELAARYGIAYPSLRSKVQRGRERLKQLLYNCCHISTDRLGNVLEVKAKNSCDVPCDPCADEH